MHQLIILIVAAVILIVVAVRWAKRPRSGPPYTGTGSSGAAPGSGRPLTK